MKQPETVLKAEEKVIYALRGLYQTYGYTQYKMSKFEEYDLYARNKDFLISDNIITFTDASGRLMALKPDVTLSIVRSSKELENSVQKVYYNESVYRSARGSKALKEITQVGLECIGAVDDYYVAEAVLLAARSLAEISPDSLLAVSHLDILSDAIARLNVPQRFHSQVLQYMEEKNLHELTALCRSAGADEKAAADLERLARLSGAPGEVLPVLRELGCTAAQLRQLENIVSAVRLAGLDQLLRIDFSVVGDLNYYNGVVFKGYVSGVPTGVISGGQYDRLMDRMGRKSRAIGFAVYLDQLERLGEDRVQYDVDIVLLYDRDTDVERLQQTVKQLTETGCSVMAQQSVPDKIRYRQLLKLGESGVGFLETNA